MLCSMFCAICWLRVCVQQEADSMTGFCHVMDAIFAQETTPVIGHNMLYVPVVHRVHGTTLNCHLPLTLVTIACCVCDALLSDTMCHFWCPTLAALYQSICLTSNRCYTTSFSVEGWSTRKNWLGNQVCCCMVWFCHALAV